MSRVAPTAAAKNAPKPTTATGSGEAQSITKNDVGTVDAATVKAAKKAAKKPLKRVFHPMLEAKELAHPKTKKMRVIATKKLDSIPEDYNPKLHKGLMRTDFNDESLWFEITARKFDKKAADLRKQGEELKALGGIKDRADAKKLLALQKRMNELRTKLQGRGVDTSRLDAKIAADLAAKTEQVAGKTEEKAA